MSTQTTIRQSGTGTEFTMALVYLPAMQQYAVIFASRNPLVNKEEIRAFPSYGRAWACFSNNYRHYKNETPSYISEEEFRGLDVDKIYPAAVLKRIREAKEC